MFPAHVVLKADDNSPSLINLAKPGKLGPVADDDESRPRQRGRSSAFRRRGPPPPLHADDEEDEKLQRQIGRSSRLRLRPSPDESVGGLPVLPLLRRRYRPSSSSSSLFSPNSLDPSPTDLDSRSLLALLGSDFDSTFMSPARPSDNIINPNGTFLPYDGDFLDDSGLGLAMPRLPVLRLPGRTSTSKKIKLTAARGQEARRKLQRYLAAYSHCPLFVRWRDLGRRFWPRWIREGSCRRPSSGTASGGSRERSCSIPSGMTCRPNQSSTKTVLWWHCRTPSAGSRRHKVADQLAPSSSSAPSNMGGSGGGSVCGWIPIKFPIITDCKCAC